MWLEKIIQCYNQLLIQLLSSLSINQIKTKVLEQYTQGSQSKIQSIYHVCQKLNHFKVFQKHISALQVTIVILNLRKWSESTIYSSLCYEDSETISGPNLMQTITSALITAGQMSYTLRTLRCLWANKFHCQTSLSQQKTQSRCLPFYSHNLRKESKGMMNLNKEETYFLTYLRKTIIPKEMSSLLTLS